MIGYSPYPSFPILSTSKFKHVVISALSNQHGKVHEDAWMQIGQACFDCLPPACSKTCRR